MERECDRPSSLLHLLFLFFCASGYLIDRESNSGSPITARIFFCLFLSSSLFGLITASAAKAIITNESITKTKRK